MSDTPPSFRTALARPHPRRLSDGIGRRPAEEKRASVPRRTRWRAGHTGARGGPGQGAATGGRPPEDARPESGHARVRPNTCGAARGGRDAHCHCAQRSDSRCVTLRVMKRPGTTGVRVSRNSAAWQVPHTTRSSGAPPVAHCAAWKAASPRAAGRSH